MRFSGAIAALVMSVIVAPSIATGAAEAAATEIGAVAEVRAATPPEAIAAGGFAVQVAEAAGSYAVPPGYSTITGWSHSAGTTAGTLTFKVYRPTGALREFIVVAADTRMVTAGSVQAFPVQIPVRPGDRIGLSSDDVQLAYLTSNPADQVGFFSPDPAPGTTKTTDGDPFGEFKLDVTATLQSDPSGPPPPGGGSQPPGGSPGGGSPPAGTALPAASKLRFLPGAFAAAASGPSARAPTRRSPGATVSYSVTRAAAVRFSVTQTRSGRRTGKGRAARCVAATKANRKGRRCTRTVVLPGNFSRTAKAGANRFRFTGRLAGRKLKPGSYTLIATPSAGGRFGRSTRRSFRITR